MQASVVDIFRNVCFWAPFCAWLTAQLVKILCNLYRTRNVDFSYLVSTGGMPSAHSAMVCGLFTSIGIVHGFGSPSFTVALAFAIITMFDASTVRWAAGQQARLLNEIIDELRTEHRFSERKLKELLGHTRLEVLVGMIIGMLVAMIVVSVPVILR